MVREISCLRCNHFPFYIIFHVFARYVSYIQGVSVFSITFPERANSIHLRKIFAFAILFKFKTMYSYLTFYFFTIKSFKQTAIFIYV